MNSQKCSQPPGINRLKLKDERFVGGKKREGFIAVVWPIPGVGVVLDFVTVLMVLFGEIFH